MPDRSTRCKEPLLDRFGLKDADGLVDDGCRREGNRLELDLAGLKLRNIENIVEQVQQAVAGFVNRIHDVTLLAVELGVEQRCRKPDNRIHRGANLVAHDREEV